MSFSHMYSQNKNNNAFGKKAGPTQTNKLADTQPRRFGTETGGYGGGIKDEGWGDVQRSTIEAKRDGGFNKKPVDPYTNSGFSKGPGQNEERKDGFDK